MFPYWDQSHMAKNLNFNCDVISGRTGLRGDAVPS